MCCLYLCYFLQSDIGCVYWIHESFIDWIFKGPVVTVLVLNTIFLVRIMFVSGSFKVFFKFVSKFHLNLKVLIIKLRSANTVEAKQYKKAFKALLVLVPLFGLTYVFLMAGPNQPGTYKDIFELLRPLLLSTQVSLFSNYIS